MPALRRAGLAATLAAGLLVSVAALPAGASPAPGQAVRSAAAAATAECTAARAAADEYREGPIAAAVDEAGTRVVELEELLVAEVALVTDAEAALAEAVTARDAVAGAVVAAEEAFVAAQGSLGSLEAELVEAQQDLTLAQTLLGGREILTREELAEYLLEVEQSGFGEYAPLLQDLADACFVFEGDTDSESDGDSEEDTDEDGLDDDDAVPTAPVARPVTARASFTG